jgi:hypothetical protein
MSQTLTVDLDFEQSFKMCVKLSSLKVRTSSSLNSLKISFEPSQVLDKLGLLELELGY